jgi:hypothetical protein
MHPLRLTMIGGITKGGKYHPELKIGPSRARISRRVTPFSHSRTGRATLLIIPQFMASEWHGRSSILSNHKLLVKPHLLSIRRLVDSIFIPALSLFEDCATFRVSIRALSLFFAGFVPCSGVSKHRDMRSVRLDLISRLVPFYVLKKIPFTASRSSALRVWPFYNCNLHTSCPAFSQHLSSSSSSLELSPPRRSPFNMSPPIPPSATAPSPARALIPMTRM